MVAADVTFVAVAVARLDNAFGIGAVAVAVGSELEANRSGSRVALLHLAPRRGIYVVVIMMEGEICLVKLLVSHASLDDCRRLL